MKKRAINYNIYKTFPETMHFLSNYNRFTRVCHGLSFPSKNYAFPTVVLKRSFLESCNKKKDGIYQDQTKHEVFPFRGRAGSDVFSVVVFPSLYLDDMGVSQNRGTPKTPQNDHF